MINQKNIFKLLVTFAMVNILSSCSPIYTAKHSYVLPRSSMGKLCIVGCSSARNNCVQLEALKYQNCITRAELARQICRTNPKRACFYEYCYTNLLHCENQFNACYENCGGKVTTTMVCTHFCK